MNCFFLNLRVRDVILLVCRGHVHERVFSIKNVIWSYKVSLSMPCFAGLPVQIWEGEWKCICVLEVSNLPLFVCWILELFQHCGIIWFVITY